MNNSNMNSQQVIEILKNYDLEKTDYSEIISTVQKIGNVAIFQITIPKGAYILRNRSEIIDLQPEPFYYEKEISIRTDTENIKPSRCNWYNQPIFYGVVPMSTHNDSGDSAQYLSLLESTKIISETDKSTVVKEEYGTIGKWRVIEDIKCSAILTNTSFSRINPGVNYYKERFEHYLSSHGNNISLFREISDYLALEFGKKVEVGREHKYGITSAFSNINFVGFGFEGMIYPSARAEGQGQGLNVALKPQSLYKLKLEAVVMKRVYFRGSNGIVLPDIHLECNRFDANGRFIWTPPTKQYSRNQVEEILRS
ncbi:MAG: hypothetical protein NT084_10685 [Bacteroidetes bacterium]|nr:hypothetical protein [Bacteroidota bacterium]